MNRVSEIMIKELVCCTPTTNLEESRNVMRKYECTKIPVIDKNHMIIGGISMNDLQEGNKKVIECMSKEMKVVEEDSTIDECLRIMILNNIEQVPVIDKQGHFCGIVTQKALLSR